jgi:hypothetical protein
VGFEYRLSFAYRDVASVANALVCLAGAQQFAEPTVHLEFRRDQFNVGVPDATVAIEEYGLYFCDHGGHGRDYLGQIIAQLVRTFGPVSVEELE